MERTEEALGTDAEIIATACPFCMTMLSDGLKNKEAQDRVKVVDLVELITQANKLD
jgi:heterodisulfide reductase subunit D